MHEDVKGFDESFRPLRRASRLARIAGLTLGPLGWFAALVVAAAVVRRTDAIELGLLVTGASCLLAAIVLSLLRLGRHREERRYADRA